MTEIKDMTLKRLRAELVFAQRRLHSHRMGMHGYCHQAWCGRYPCPVTVDASKTLIEVSQELAARNDARTAEVAHASEVADLIERARLDWRQ